MMSDKYAAYGSASILGEKMRKEGKDIQRKPTLFVLTCCLLVPLLIFVVTFWLRSFETHYQNEIFTNILCYFLLLIPLAFGALTCSINLGDAKPMALLTVMSLVAWLLGFLMGGDNFHTNMRPFYDVSRLNTYPTVDASKYGGQQLMDAGQILFTPGTKLSLKQSMGFKNGDTYCVAPIVSSNASQSTFDFWAVGINCCSAHVADFHCGEYLNPFATSGLRLMDDDKREMFRLVVKKAEAEFSLKVAHPIFLYWLSDPAAEIDAYEDEGMHYFVTAAFGLFCLQLCVVVCAAAVFARM